MPSHSLGTEAYNVTYATTDEVLECLKRIVFSVSRFFFSILIVFLPLELGLISALSPVIA